MKTDFFILSVNIKNIVLSLYIFYIKLIFANWYFLKNWLFFKKLLYICV